MMGGVDLLYMVFGEMFYGCGVVGGVLQKIVVKYGARTHSARRYNAYTCIYNWKTFRLGNIRGDIFVTYFICTTLLVGL